MSYVVTLENFTPGARYDSLPWTQARIEEGSSANGPWSAVDTVALSPLDADPTEPQSRDFTTVLATEQYAWFRIVWIDGAGHEQNGGAVYNSPETVQNAGETVAELLEGVQDVGFDLTDAQLLRYFNARHRKMITEARWLRVTMQLGSTELDRRTYPIDPGVVELYELTIDGLPYRKARRQDIVAGRLGRLSLRGYGGVFIPDADESGVVGLTIHPAPSADLPMLGFAAIVPQDLGLEDRPLVPPDYYEGLQNGTIATGFSRDSEQLNAADRFERMFEVEVERLRRLARRRFRGPGPAQIRILGVNA